MNKKEKDKVINKNSVDSGNRSKTRRTTNSVKGKTVKRRTNNGKVVRRTPIKIIPLGGLNEIGKNMTCFDCGKDMFIVDCGMGFPDPDMLGVKKRTYLPSFQEFLIA